MTEYTLKLRGCLCPEDTAGNKMHLGNCIGRMIENLPAQMQGWQCPACGGGCSPLTTRCPCTPISGPAVVYSGGGFGVYTGCCGTMGGPIEGISARS